MYIYILTFRVQFIWISIQGIPGSLFSGSMDLQSEDPRIYSKEIQINRTCSGFCLFGSPIRGFMDLHSDSNVYCKLNYKNKSPLWRSMDSMIGDPKKENPYNKNVCLDLHSVDPWIYSKEIQIHRTQNRFCLFRSPLSRSMDPLSGDPWNPLMEIQINRTLNRFFLLGSPLSRSLDPLIGDPRIP